MKWPLFKCNRTITGMMLAIILIMDGYGNISTESKPAAKPSSFEQQIPFAVLLPDDQKAVCTWMRIRSEPRSKQSINTITFVGGKVSPAVQEALKAQICSGVLFGSLMWQENLQDVQWTILDAPWIDRTSNLAALTLGLVATASGLSYPSDTIVLGSINPDHSLGIVSDIEKRIDAAAAAGMKRVVIPYLQRIQTSEHGSMVNLQSRIEASGMKCVPVQTLTELIEVVLGRPSPKIEIDDSMSYESKIFSFLDAQCRREFFALESLSSKWPRDPAKLAVLKPMDQTLWREIVSEFDEAKRLYQAGVLYSARKRFVNVEAKLHALSSITFAHKTFEYKDYEQRSKLLTQKIKNLQMTQDAGASLESSLFEAERSDRLAHLAYELEAAQVLARQAFASRSDADSHQKEEAQVRLQRSVEESEYLLPADIRFFSELKRVWSFNSGSTIQPKTAELLPNLRLTYLSFSDHLTNNLKKHAHVLKEKLIFDQNLLAQTKTASELRKTIKINEEEKTDQTSSPSISQVGFVPGAAYVPQKIESISEEEVPQRNELLQCFDWANDFSRLASLDQKYIQLEKASAVEKSGETRGQQSIILQRMLEYAELQARKSALQTKRLGINPQVLYLIFEEAGALKTSDDTEQQLEGLRQYWRCSLLGGICWQLVSQKIPVPVLVEEKKTAPSIANNLKISSVGQTATNELKASSVYTPAFQTQTSPSSMLRNLDVGVAELKPISVPALPLTAEDLAIIGNE